MKILFVVFEALLGGHVISALTIAREMQRRGYDIVFAGKRGQLTPAIEKTIRFHHLEIPVWHGCRQTYFTWKSLRAIRGLGEVMKEEEIDLVHSFDARSFLHAYPAGLLGNVPVLGTLCGGIDPQYNLPRAPKFIVFSDEQKEKMVQKFGWNSERVEVIRTRLDVDNILSGHGRLTDEEARTLGMAPDIIPKIMMISSFDNTKIRSIIQVLTAFETLLSQGERLQLVLIGGKGELHDLAAARAKEINGRFGPSRVLLTGPVMNAFRLLERATMVIGVGRSAFEGMAHGRPTLIVGANGYAGTVSPDTVRHLAYYNFSGRNIGEDAPAQSLADGIRCLLAQPSEMEALGRFCREYVRREIDVKAGGERIGQLYHEILSHREPFGRILNFVSFFRALAPVFRDNGIHTLKQSFSSIIHRGERASKPARG